jgi:mono/diheme cytochrome c family protein
MSRLPAIAFAASILGAAACGDTLIVDPMERQPKMRAFAANTHYEDGRSMRAPPSGTVSREQHAVPLEIASGRDREGKTVSAIPVALTRELLDHGRKDFEIYCAVCHGLVGDGYSPVSTQMSLRPPPSLHKLANPSPGHVFQVISEGFGLMPSYATQLEPEERWAVVAYVEALRRSQSAKVADAPKAIQDKLAKETAP